jgi:signal transduction histidine kinase
MREMETGVADGLRDDAEEDSEGSLRARLDAAQRAEVDATRANDSKTIFLRMASHELRTPLQALHLQLTRFERMNPERSQEGDKVLQGMKRSARRLNELCDAIQTYARIESDRLEVEPADIDPVELATQAVEDVRNLSGGVVPTVEILAQSAPLRFRTDPILFKSIVSNLLTTSLKVAGKEPLELELAQTPTGLRISLTDRTGGIPERERMSFGEIDPTARGELSALGLGPTIIREIVTALGGTLGLQGAGASGVRITVVVPRSETEDPRP